MPLIYLAHPIDQAGHNPELADSIRAARAVLLMAGHNLYIPGRAFDAPHLDRRVEQVNRTALSAADALVAILPAGTPTIGVGCEIEYCTSRGVPTVVVTDAHGQTLAGLPYLKIVPYLDRLAPALAEMLELYPPRGEILASHDTVRFVLNDNGGPLPSRAYHDDAGLDLACATLTTIQPGTFADVPTSVIGTQLPGWSWGLVVGRSSTLRKRGLLVPPSIIDAGWRGPLYAGAWNLTDRPVEIHPGDRIAQLIVLDNATARCSVQRVDKLDPHPRGTNGFGSSGG